MGDSDQCSVESLLVSIPCVTFCMHELEVLLRAYLLYIDQRSTWLLKHFSVSWADVECDRM